MFKAKREIYNQYASLRETLLHMKNKEAEVRSVMSRAQGLTFFGCGSSYSLSKGAAVAARMYGVSRASAIAAGDYIIDPAQYEPAIRDTCIVFVSRSGQTTEMLIAAQLIRDSHPDTPIISLCATEGSPIRAFADVSVEIPWAFDESTCQTQTVTNLYAALLAMLSQRVGNAALTAELAALAESGEEYLAGLDAVLSPLYDKRWSNVVVLADGVLEGVAEEGALAFNEICMKFSHYYHLLDVRHGPMVLVAPGTLIVMYCSDVETEKQLKLLRDIRGRGACVVAMSCNEAFAEADTFIKLPKCSAAAGGLRFIGAIQVLALGCALAEGIDPDDPDGLTPWVKL